MNRKHLVKAVSATAGIPARDAEPIIDAVLDAIARTLAAGEPVSIVNFGTFTPAPRQARAGRNPATGEAVRIEATVVPHFQASSRLRELVAGKRPLPEGSAIKKDPKTPRGTR